MRKVKIITDSSADLPKAITEQRGIDVVPARIILGAKGYPDDGRLSTKELFEFADSAGVLPTTAPPTEHQFQESFQKWLEGDYDILFIGVSGKMAETVRNAESAASKLLPGRISIVDSLSASCGTGLQVLEAADLADRGADLQEITLGVYPLRDKVRASIMLDTLKYAYIGGRCSRFVSILGDTMNIKPVIDVKDGDMALGDHFRGKNYISQFVEKVMGDPERVDPKRIFVTNCFESKTGEVEERLRNDLGFKNVIVVDTSPATAVNFGLGAIGIMYRYK